MKSEHSTAARRDLRRRLYVFLAVALAQFLFAMALAGTLCQGFAVTPICSKSNQSQRAALALAETELTKSTQSYDRLRKQAHAAFTAYEAARRKRNAFSDSLLSQAAAEPTSASTEEFGPALSDAAGSAASASPSSTAHAKKVPNPLRKDLDAQLDELERQRTELLLSLTSSHPAVEALDLTIAEVQSQIAHTPAEIDAPVDVPAPDTAIRAKPIANWPPAPTKKQEAEYRTLAAAENAALVEYEKSLHQLNAAWRVQTSAYASYQRAAMAAAADNAQAAVIGARVTTAIVIAALWCLVVAWLVARRARVGDQTYTLPAEVRQSLGVPVLGLLPMHAGAASEQPLREPAWVARFVRLSEAWLVGVVVLLAVVSVLDAQFFRDLIADPLSACSKRFW